MLYTIGDDHQANLAMFRTSRRRAINTTSNRIIGDDWHFDRSDLIIKTDDE